MADEPAGPPPVHYGGQAVLEGVMMRGQDAWAVAVRRPTGDIYVERRDLAPLSKRVRLFRLPFFRGIGVLADSLAIGVRALAISGNQSLGEDEQLTDKQMNWSLGIGAGFFTLVFILLPALGTNWLSHRLPDDLIFNLVEGLLRLAFFLVYILLIGQLRDIRRVFQYHGAEHKAIHCYEADLPLEPEQVDRFPTLHVRCGTNFLLILFVVTLVLFTVAFSAVGRPPLLVRVPLQILAVPVIVGIAYEGIRLGAGRERSVLVRAIMKPGLWLQMLTTKPPTHDMIEVAIRALEHVLPPEERHRIAPLPSPVTHADDGTGGLKERSGSPPEDSLPGGLKEPSGSLPEDRAADRGLGSAVDGRPPAG
jgi:uncharacterized protein YqhQ